MTHRMRLDLTGERFGRLTVLSRDYELEDYAIAKGRVAQARWKCLCDCGQTTSVLAHALIQGYVRSCGCLRSENARRMGKANHKNKETVI